MSREKNYLIDLEEEISNLKEELKKERISSNDLISENQWVWSKICDYQLWLFGEIGTKINDDMRFGLMHAHKKFKVIMEEIEKVENDEHIL